MAYTILLWTLLAALVLGYTWRQLLRQRSRLRNAMVRPDEVASDQAKDVYTAIEPLLDFDWKSTQPIKLRPFKPKYHLTMGQSRSFGPLSSMLID